MEITQLTTFLGWTTLINFGLITLTSIILIAFKGSIVKIHSELFSISEKGLYEAYLNFLAQYKVLIIVLNLVPYLALRLM